MASGLPPGWEVRHSKSRNLPYYFNATTSESRWEPPEGTKADLLAHYMAEHHSSDSPITNSNKSTVQTEKIRASHLLVKHNASRRPSSWKQANIERTEAEARTILADYERQIRSGTTTLAILAVTESDCSSARKGGDLGFFGRGEMQKAFEEAAFSLKPGELSSIVSTDSGVHLIERMA